MQERAWNYQTPCRSPPGTPFPSSGEAKVLTPLLQTSMTCPSPALPLTSCPFYSIPLTTSWSFQCATQTLCSGLLPARSCWGNALLPPTSRASSLSYFGFCSNVIFSVMLTLAFLLKMATCPLCWYLQVAQPALFVCITFNFTHTHQTR